MKVILKKYKIPIICTGVLLSVVIVLLSINKFNNLKQNADKNMDKDTAVSEPVSRDDKTDIIGDKQTKDNNYIEKNEQTEKDETKDETIEIQNQKDKETHKDEKNTGGEKKPVNKKDKDTYVLKNSDRDKETKSAQVKEIGNNPSPDIVGERYTVKKGDTLFLIAQRADTSVDHLMALNNLHSDMIYENQTLKIKGSAVGSQNQVASRGNERSEDLYWLSRIIHSEAQGESYRGKVAVGNVIMNRVSSELFPNTIKGVIFDKQDGYTQFSPVIDGTIYNSPDGESISAAKEILGGSKPVGDALYFLNPRESTNFWIVNNRKHMTTIGLHDFYY